jgi:hypothetical protein
VAALAFWEIHERVDDVSKSWEGLVDHTCFF